MELSDIINKLEISFITGDCNSNIEISGGFCSDLLSDVMGNAREGQIWITIQVHKNIIAVASLKDLAAIILVNDLNPPIETIETANEQGVIILKTKLSAFETAGRLYNLLKNV